MRKSDRAEQARRALDEKFLLGTVAAIRARPRSGWIRAIRGGLGMSQETLAARLGVSRNAVVKLEGAERHGGITITKLSEVAAALDCSLVYALVPNTTLENTVRRQANAIVARQLGYVGATMALEDQMVGADDESALFRRTVQTTIERGDIWKS